MTSHFARSWRSVEKQVRQVVIVNQPSDDTDNIFVSYQIFKLGWAVFFHPWHLGAFGGGCRHVERIRGLFFGAVVAH